MHIIKTLLGYFINDAGRQMSLLQIEQRFFYTFIYAEAQLSLITIPLQFVNETHNQLILCVWQILQLSHFNPLSVNSV